MRQMTDIKSQIDEEIAKLRRRIVALENAKAALEEEGEAPEATARKRKKCAVCGKGFLAKRADRIYHSAACAKRAWNERHPERNRPKQPVAAAAQ